MAKAVKLADIAEQLGVSTVTVSKALSGQKGVSEAMREKIKQLADELGYKQPSRTPFVGSNFNVTRAGIHADGLLKNEEIYNIFMCNFIVMFMYIFIHMFIIYL